ncbi:MAG: 4Fe-4S dicluster domain-containing protein [Candidatus Bathyarchaeota archaeon]|nr:4Fe-4S dicluster domain-containing protein [Candidatus Bathyarchaeota archaeon]
MPKGIRGHNPRQFASVNPSKCTGCGICEYVCALEKEGFLRNPLRSRIRVIRLNSFFNTTMTCRFCEDAPCANACPCRALKQSERGGVLIIDEDRCNACGWCVQACSYGGISLHPQKKVVACDLCGGESKCVEFRPEEALELATEDAAPQKMWVSAIEKLPSETERLGNLIKKRALTDIFKEAEEKAKRLEEKLAALNEREMKLLTGKRPLRYGDIVQRRLRHG